MRVLVVEDDHALGVFLQRGLTFEGHEVEWVGDGEAAVGRARSWAPDLVVLDLGLPQRDGHEVLAVLSEECLVPRCWFSPAAPTSRNVCAA